MSDKPPRYIVIVHEDIDRISVKLGIHKAMREYTDDFELCIEPTICAPGRMYVIDRQGIEEKWQATGEELDKLFQSGELDAEMQSMDANPINFR